MYANTDVLGLLSILFVRFTANSTHITITVANTLSILFVRFRAGENSRSQEADGTLNSLYEILYKPKSLKSL